MKNSAPEKEISLSHSLHSRFRSIAEMTSHRMGSPTAFFSALFLIILWAASGFYLGFNQTWQLIINTGTTIATFLLVILVQNTQYRQDRAIQLKLDEILYGTRNTRDLFMGIEEESDKELDLLKEEFKELRKKCIERMNKKKKHL